MRTRLVSWTYYERQSSVQNIIGQYLRSQQDKSFGFMGRPGRVWNWESRLQCSRHVVQNGLYATHRGHILLVLLSAHTSLLFCAVWAAKTLIQSLSFQRNGKPSSLKQKGRSSWITRLSWWRTCNPEFIVPLLDILWNPTHQTSMTYILVSLNANWCMPVWVPLLWMQCEVKMKGMWGHQDLSSKLPENGGCEWRPHLILRVNSEKDSLKGPQERERQMTFSKCVPGSKLRTFNQIILY